MGRRRRKSAPSVLLPSALTSPNMWQLPTRSARVQAKGALWPRQHRRAAQGAARH